MENDMKCCVTFCYQCINNNCSNEASYKLCAYRTMLKKIADHQDITLGECIASKSELLNAYRNEDNEIMKYNLSIAIQCIDFYISHVLHYIN